MMLQLRGETARSAVTSKKTSGSEIESSRMRHLSRWLLSGWVVSIAATGSVPAQTLHQGIAAEGAASLATAARKAGDAERGAVVFYQPYLACTRCHSADKENNRLGPDLTKLGKDVSDEHLIESILEPSKVVREGFEAVTVLTTGGAIATGILISESEKEVVVRDAGQDFKVTRFDRKKVAELSRSETSIMPAGQVNALTSRQQFLDLARYLIEIRDGGAARARELEPAPSLYAARPLPEYEKRLDHAGILRDLDRAAFQRGEKIYNRLCINCHGTHDRPGSLPTSLKFASGSFKNGNDPYTMYQTLTRGFGMMAAQTWMVPKQKYDVIHYVREAYLKTRNPSQHFEIDRAYLDRLPEGDSRGPEPSRILPWEQMDYGPNLVMTLEIGRDAKNFAYKGNAVRLDAGPGGVSQGRYWMIFDYDTLRVAAAWSGEDFCDWNGINFNGRHEIHPRLAGKVHVANPTGPGWGRPADGSFEDLRLVGRDDRRYGPLPREWAHYKGMYYHGPNTLIEYTVGDTKLLEMPGVIATTPEPVFTRTFNVGPRSEDLILQVAHRDESGTRLVKTADAVLFGPPASDAYPQTASAAKDGVVPDKTGHEHDGKLFVGQARESADTQAEGWLVAGTRGHAGRAEWLAEGGDLRLKIPAGNDPLSFKLWFATVEKEKDVQPLVDSVVFDEPDQDLSALTRGGPSRWPQVLKSEAVLGDDDGPFAVDVLRHPVDNPWFCRMRLTGFDFTPDGDSAIVSAWEGSIWRVSGFGGLSEDRPAGESRKVELTWRRIASGLFQPLGVKIVDGKTYVTCRDQLSILHDLNGDGEIDYFESFNNDHQVTDHFHEFAMGLQADDEGNFYYAKSARHALTALVPHHGTLLRVSKDGSRTDIIAKGFRAANGVCLNPDGTFIVTDQEGHWNPKNRINYIKEDGFYGNMFGYHDVTDSSDDAMEQPLCWITNGFDRSPAELLWVDSPRWGPLNRRLLNLSYGYGAVYIVPHEKIGGQAQGGMCELPIKRFPTGVMRGRFHPRDGQLYLCGMFAWAGSQTQPGGLYRLRYTGKPVHLPVELKARRKGVRITFSGELEAESAAIAKNYGIKVWSLKRTAGYGSKHYDERSLEVASARLDSDGRTVSLEIPEIAPTWSMEIRYKIRSASGTPVRGKIHNTIHTLGE